MSGARRWCPERWRDDEMPVGETPDAFLHQFGPGWYLTDPADPSGKSWNDEIFPGEVVAFLYWEKRGRFEIEVMGEVRWPSTLPEGPGIHYWIPGEPETSSDDLESLVIDCELENGSHEIEAVYWSERPVLFRFELVGETASFVEVPS